MSFNSYKLCFYYQVWHTNQLAAFEALKQLRSVYPTDEVILVVAGLKRENSDEYDKNFTQIIKQHFNITKTDYLYIDDHPYMSTTALRVPHTAVIRDEYMKFAHIWLDQFVSLPSDDVDIIVNGSDDWVPLRPIPINFEIDVCGRICEIYDWMNGNKLKKYINIDTMCWIQHGHYMNFQKLKKAYTEENKKYIENAIKNTYPPNIPLFLDYMHSLWNSLVFEKMINAHYITEISPSDHNSSFDKENHNSLHGSKALRNLPISQEMVDLNIIPTYK
jgi:hypothetical protein